MRVYSRVNNLIFRHHQNIATALTDIATTSEDYENAERIVDCLNACEDMIDPEAEINELRRDVREKQLEIECKEDEIQADNEEIDCLTKQLETLTAEVERLQEIIDFGSEQNKDSQQPF